MFGAEWAIHGTQLCGVQQKGGLLKILASYEAKIAKICDFWTFWLVI